MLQTAVESLIKGVIVDGFTVYAKKVSRGRFREELNLEVYLRRGEEEDSLIYVKVFYGRKPYYKPWVEFFSINNSMNIGVEAATYFDSVFEEKLLSLFSQFIDSGGRIYVEYYGDGETRRQLEAGFPLPVTRLGYRLLKLGFTWLRDWYFPEGFMEGGVKLQGEKPVDDESRSSQLREVYLDVKAFLEEMKISCGDKLYAARAVEGAEKILSQESS